VTWLVAAWLAAVLLGLISGSLRSQPAMAIAARPIPSSIVHAR
jgi:hypothetical protein